MTTTSLIIALLMLLMSCQSQNCKNSSDASACYQAETSRNSSQNSQQQSEDGHHRPEDVPYEASLFDADVTLSKFNSSGEEKIMKAISIIKKVIRSKEFRDRVIEFTFNGQRAFVDNGGLSNEEIYQKILEGSEDLDPGIDHEMDLDLELYFSRRNTVGYTKPDGLRIWMNSKFFNAYTPAEVAGNIFHEWTHKLGFEHAFYYSVSRESSVPYALGYLIEELGKKMESP